MVIQLVNVSGHNWLETNLRNANHVMPVVADGRESSDELVVRYTQVVLEFPCGQVPDEQREWLLCLVATNTNFTIGRGEKTVEESVFTRFKGCLQVLGRDD